MDNFNKELLVRGYYENIVMKCSFVGANLIKNY